MRRTMFSVVLILGSLVAVSVAVDAAPLKSPNITSISIESCTGAVDVDEVFTIEQSSGGTVFDENGDPILAKRITGAFAAELVLVDGGTTIGSASETFDDNFGANGFAATELSQCEFGESFVDGPFPLDESAAEFFGVEDPAPIGELVVVEGTFEGTAWVFAPKSLQ